MSSGQVSDIVNPPLMTPGRSACDCSVSLLIGVDRKVQPSPSFGASDPEEALAPFIRSPHLVAFDPWVHWVLHARFLLTFRRPGLGTARANGFCSFTVGWAAQEGRAYPASAAIMCITFGVPSSWKRSTCDCSTLSALVTRSCWRKCSTQLATKNVSTKRDESAVSSNTPQR